MERLWAPWRREFVLKETPSSAAPAGQEAQCILCEVLQVEDGPGNLILHRGRRCFVLMNKYPYSNGHLMVVPLRHMKEFGELSPEEGGEMFLLAQQCVSILREKMGAQGFNLGLNLDKVAGAGIDDHLHLHIVPRWQGDHNFMTVLGEVRVIPEHLQKTYETLRPAFPASE